MNSENTPENTLQTQRILEAYKCKLQSNLKYYNNRYQTDMEFRIKESQRNSELIEKKYHTDPEYRNNMLQKAKDRYHAKKQMAERDKQD